METCIAPSRSPDATTKRETDIGFLIGQASRTKALTEVLLERLASEARRAASARHIGRPRGDVSLGARLRIPRSCSGGCREV